MIAIPGIGAVRRKALAAEGIETLQDFLYRFPVSFRDYSRLSSISRLRPGEAAAFEGEVSDFPRRKLINGIVIITVRIVDESGIVLCRWFNQPYIAGMLKSGMRKLFYGIVSVHAGQLQVVNPSVDAPGRHTGLEPVYASIHGIPGKTYREAVRLALESYTDQLPDRMPKELRQRHGLLSYRKALRSAHAPQSWAELEAARRRLAFEELLEYQIALMSDHARPRPGTVIQCAREELRPLLDAWPFVLTRAQNRVLDEILADLDRPTAMTRLVQGDVGSGKTALAFLALYATYLRGYQGVLMAPTEVLARQHYAAALRDLASLGVRPALLIGGLSAKERALARRQAASGEADVLIGTHALISETAEYACVGLVITDEQHRFGVRQRSRLEEKGLQPNVLVMSATPIPRTLALILYGDLDVSVVDELPPGRTPIKTYIVPEHKRKDMYGFLRRQMKDGGQVYVICPRVGDSGVSGWISAQRRYEELREEFPEFTVGLVHGKLSPQEKDHALSSFSRGETHMLVSTTVVEVGVNIPNANVILIEGADNFGLAQLHQLRGRVGRGQRASFCFLMGESDRLRVLASATDGFEIAQKDLELRGPGEILGTRQHGVIDGRLAAFASNTMLLQETHDAALRLLSMIDDEAARNYILYTQERLHEKNLSAARN